MGNDVVTVLLICLAVITFGLAWMSGGGRTLSACRQAERSFCNRAQPVRTAWVGLATCLGPDGPSLKAKRRLEKRPREFSDPLMHQTADLRGACVVASVARIR